MVVAQIILEFENANWGTRRQKNPAPDYANFPSIPFDDGKRSVNWIKSHTKEYSREAQELVVFFDLFSCGRPFHDEPLYYYLIDDSNYFGEDLVSFRYERLEKYSKGEGIFWTTKYYEDVEEIIDVPTDFHVRQILLRYTPDEWKLVQFLSKMEDFERQRRKWDTCRNDAKGCDQTVINQLTQGSICTNDKNFFRFIESRDLSFFHLLNKQSEKHSSWH